jgi:UDP-perosamine 4-acetyltransferase
MAESLLVLGSGGHAGVVIDIVDAVGGYEIIGMASDDDDPSRIVAGRPILSDLDGMGRFRAEGIRHVAIGIGGWTDNEARRTVYEEAVGLGFDPVTLVHPSASVAPGAAVGRGSVICAGAILATGVKVGENSIVYHGATVDHETVIGDHVLISSGATVGGRVAVGDGSLIALGATVCTDVTVGPESLVGAGAVVIRDVAAGTRVFGVPARPAPD